MIVYAILTFQLLGLIALLWVAYRIRNTMRDIDEQVKYTRDDVNEINAKITRIDFRGK